MRLQVALTTAAGSFLQTEVIAEFDAFDQFQKDGDIRARYALAKHRKGLSTGGMVLQRADLPRTWDVPVGSRIETPPTPTWPSATAFGYPLTWGDEG